MLRSKDINIEIKALDEIIGNIAATETEIAQGNLKALTLLIKLCRDSRANQVELMKHYGIALQSPEKIEPKKEDSNEKK